MASVEGTKQYAGKFEYADNTYRQFGKTGFTVSCVGFGGYKIHVDSKVNEKALRKSLLNGINIIDTSSNYMNGGSEILIGKVIDELSAENKVSRDNLVVVSKAGYVQGSVLKQANAKEEQGSAYPEMVKYTKEVWHCIHPDFLEDQLIASLERLNAERIDVYLLHNPEYYLLLHKKLEKLDMEEARKEYYRRIENAFRWMEKKVAEGIIGSYGISSNSLPVEPAEYEFTSLEKLLEIAENISSDNHFHVIQFPLNIIEKGAAQTTHTAEGEKSLLELADSKNLAVMTNRPLNALSGNNMIRLATFPESEPGEVSYEFSQQISKVSNLEKRLDRELMGLMPESIPNDSIIQTFSAGVQLEEALKDFKTREYWEHIKHNIFLPQVFNLLNYLSHNIGEDDNWTDWVDRYAKALVKLTDIISRYYDNIAQKRSGKLSSFVDELCEDLKTSPTLSQKAVRSVFSSHGVHTVLVGMRRTEYVKDALETLKAGSAGSVDKLMNDFTYEG